MGVSQAIGAPAGPELESAPPERSRRRSALAVPSIAVAVGLLLALAAHAHRLGGVPGVLWAGMVGLVLFAACGDALAQALVPAAWGPLRGLFSLALGAAASGIVLMAFGVARVPLHVSLWLTLALGVAASVVVRRRGLGERRLAAPGLGARRELVPWVVALAIVFAASVVPTGRLGLDTIYGQNPDATQVAGIAVLFQHAPPTATDIALPLDVVPPEWRFRYPIFYPLAAASTLGHLDPIGVFPGMVGLLVVACAFGFAMLAVEFLGAPRASGPLIAVAIGISWVVEILAWHPYWNQLWGLALLPYTLLFGWRLLRDGGGRTAVAFGVSLLMLWLAYPLALPYPLVILAALLFGAYWRRPRMPRLSGVRGWVGAIVVLAVLAPAVVGAVAKLREAVAQLLSPGSALWGGDVTHFDSLGTFVGTGGGVVPAVIVVAVAGFGLTALPRRARLALGGVLAALLLLDLRFRLVSSGTYMDFKHLSFVGTIVLTLAAAGVARLLWSGRRRLVVAGGVLALVWLGATVRTDGDYALGTPAQVTPQMLQIRQWAARLPPGSSVRVDIPSVGLGGYQLWGVYMLGDHPVDSPTPVLHTTYAHARYGLRADYSLSLRYRNNDPRQGPQPPQLFASPRPLYENSEFVLRRIVWPERFAGYPDTASTALITS